MLGSAFQQLQGNNGYVMPWIIDSLRWAKADYLPHTSSTAHFHSYLGCIAMAEWRKEQDSKSPTPVTKTTGQPRVEKAKPSAILHKYYKEWRAFLICALVSLAPLAGAVCTRRWLGRWALVPIAIAAIWLLIGAWCTHWYLTFELNLDFSGLFGGNESLESVVKTVTTTLRGPIERYEFLAKTITFGDVKGNTVLLGSPVYIALGGYEGPA